MEKRWGKKMETLTDFLLFGSKITADAGSSQKIKRYSPLGRKYMTNLNSMLKSRDITLPTKVCIIKAIFIFFLQHSCADVKVGP